MNMEKMTMETQLAIALELIDFCGRDLSMSVTVEFFKARVYDITKEDERRIFLTAYSLIVK